MAAMASSAFYRGRDEPLGVKAEHLPHNLAQYVSALEHRVHAEQARASRTRSAVPYGDEARVRELLAGAHFAQRMAAAVQAPAHLDGRITAVRDAAAALRHADHPLHATLSDADAYWDDYLYAGLVPEAAPSRARPTQTPLAEPEAPALRQRRPPPDEAPPDEAPPAPDARPTALSSDRSLQEALSAELLRMAGALRQNSAAFADALERDRLLVEQAGAGLEQNLDLMTRTRGQLGAFTRKARRMGWFTLGSIASVVVCWMVLFVVIRLT
ncbi:hypothetical protein MCAP1_002761 [Malassezia caprae]|uniref:Uncharacterized protein n=1 Tax=Malassezia caprae TaxID=1381934 RepID=A0AAF0J100_9BASI|nr:hypothetical protein MCAP1_002761 [Malassezia caprae]